MMKRKARSARQTRPPRTPPTMGPTGLEALAEPLTLLMLFTEMVVVGTAT